jgi:hypothetical protein
MVAFSAIFKYKSWSVVVSIPYVIDRIMGIENLMSFHTRLSQIFFPPPPHPPILVALTRSDCASNVVAEESIVRRIVVLSVPEVVDGPVIALGR